jgi:hypothetical protein
MATDCLQVPHDQEELMSVLIYELVEVILESVGDADARV